MVVLCTSLSYCTCSAVLWMHATPLLSWCDELLSWGERGVGVARRRSQACRIRSPPASAAYEPQLCHLGEQRGPELVGRRQRATMPSGSLGARMQRAPNYDVASGARSKRPWWAESPSVAYRAAACARASAAAAGCARTHSAPSLTRSRRRARWLSVSPAPATSRVSLGAARAFRAAPSARASTAAAGCARAHSAPS